AKRVDHIFGKTIVATTGCPLLEPAGVAVNETSGDIYVVEKGEKHRVDRFNSSGECIGHWGVAGPEAIAVDNSSSELAGDVYVSAAAEAGSEEHVVVKRYDAEGHLLATLKKFKIDEEKPPTEEEF